MDETRSFPITTHRYDTYRHDGYVISGAIKLLIDACLKDFPEMLFMHDLVDSSQDDEYAEYDKSPRTYSPLDYAIRVSRLSGSGWSIRAEFECLTSVMTYLIEQGAGIGYIGYQGLALAVDLTMIPTQLFVGMPDSFRLHKEGAASHIFHHTDIVRLYRNKQLSMEDMPRLVRQAFNGLRYGDFSDKVTYELVRVYCMLDTIQLDQCDINDSEFRLSLVKVDRLMAIIKSGMIARLEERLLSAYLNYNVELIIGFLQAFHQLQPDFVLCILGALTGLDIAELAGIGNRIMSKHEAEFPVFQLRR